MRSLAEKIMTLACLAAVSVALPAQFRGDHDPVPMPGTELRVLHSAVMDQDFHIYVQLPFDYVADGSKRYPVMYVTDGNRFFPAVANISTVLGFPTPEIPQVIVVGIAYEIRDMSQWAAWRTRDLTPTVHPATEANWENQLRKMTGDTTLQVQSGGASRFLEFICDELVPFIETAYPVDDQDRALGGYSYGGLFTLYAMFRRPGVFKRYFAGSPSIFWDSGVLFGTEREFASTHDDLQARLFLSAGELEGENTLTRLKQLSDSLESRNYPGLELQSHVFENENHRTAVAASVMRAFTWLYSK